ncbi:Na+/H+ antiporter NhaC family protein [Salinifilum aidingensis]
MADSFLSLVPPVLAIALVVLTRKVLLSLGVGILAGIALVHDFDPVAGGQRLFGIVAGIFVADGGVNTEKVFNLAFLLFLGMMAALVSVCGGSRAFGEWARRRIRTRRGALFLPAVAGVVVFIDDYFNALVVGNVSRPVTDRFRVSRAKLAYAVDSTSAPVCVSMPVSSWGAYIVSVLAGVFAAHELNVGALEGFVRTVPLNYYAVGALVMVLCAVAFRIDFGPMRRHERRAVRGEGLGELERDASALEDGAAPDGKIRDLVLPIAVLVVGTVAAMVATGARAGGSADPLVVFENTDVPTSLLIGSVLGWLVSVVFAARRSVSRPLFLRGLGTGVRSMMPAIWILLFAWTIIEVIDDLGTGEYLAGLVSGQLSLALMPVLTFLVCGFMAVSTGTSWGTFGIMLPIAGQIAVTVDPALLFPLLGAVLAGAIFGDHCSPISDTTIMSSAGAQVNHIDHVVTQLPYALLIAAVAAVGYLVLGLTGSGVAGLLAVLVLLALAVAALRWWTLRAGAETAVAAERA